jgi:hypothetical protein
MGLGNVVFGYDPKSIENKGKKKQVEPYQAKNLLHTMGNNQQNEKAAYRIGESICKPYI